MKNSHCNKAGLLFETWCIQGGRNDILV